ncbi:solute carrier family 46 member 3-like [Ostrea edulis]|uniref:solute carrier family 46 member 3-like n=1 Tax=Ostrea edulis TaxID=37623 RepID=UPI0020940367|nr:solute carrier family 46 member 3-like [Ostrea edulis]
MESLKTDPQYRRNIIPICVMLFTFGFAYSVGSYSYGEYGHEAFHYRSDHSNRSLCDTNTSSEEYRQEQIVQSKVSKWSTYMSLSQGIPLLISAGLFSSLSDSKGRKPLILVSLIGVFLKTLLMSIAVACKWNVYVFLVFIFIDGCCGSWVTQLSISMAMVSDLTSVGKSRSFLIAFVGFMVSLGYACGSFSSGFIIKKLGYSWSLGISSIVCVMTMGILYFVQETLQEHKRIRLDCNIKSYLKNLVQFYVDDDPINQHSSKWKYVLCLSALVCTLLPRLGSFSVEIYYIMNSPFCFTPVTIGIFQTSKSIGSDCVILVGIKIMQYKLSDEMISLVGTLSAIVSFIMIGFAKSTNFMIIATVVGALGMCSIPLIRSVMSKMTPAHKQGTMYAGIAIVETMCGCVGSVIGSSIYSATVDIYRGAAFLVFSVFLLLASVFLILLIISNKQRKNGYQVLQGTVSPDDLCDASINVK